MQDDDVDGELPDDDDEADLYGPERAEDLTTGSYSAVVLRMSPCGKGFSLQFATRFEEDCTEDLRAVMERCALGLIEFAAKVEANVMLSLAEDVEVGDYAGVTLVDMDGEKKPVDKPSVFDLATAVVGGRA